MTTATAAPEIQRALLAAATQHPDLLDQLDPGLFFADDARAYLGILREMVSTGARPELALLIEAAATRDILPAATIFDLASGEYALGNVPHYLDTLRQHAQRRRTLDAARALQARLQRNGEAPGAALADFWEQVGGATATPHEPVRIALDAPVPVLRRMREQGDPIPTGITALDERLRGGMRPGKALVIGGTAGAGKTSLGIQMARAAAEAGCAVACLMADEGREPAIIRLGQQGGWEREPLEAAHEATLDAFEQELEGRAILFPDPDAEEGVTVEAVAETLVQTYPGRRAFLLVDSIQTVRTRQAPGERVSLRERVMDNARTLRRLALEHNLVAVYTSEVNRSWYRSRKEEDRASDLAAFAEARIEFSADVLLTMRAMDEDPDLVELRIPKNRLGTRQGFLLRLDRARARFEAVDGSAATTARDLASAHRVDEATETILRELRDHPGLTRRQLQELVGVKVAVFSEALNTIKTSGIVRTEPKGSAVHHYLAEVPR